MPKYAEFELGDQDATKNTNLLASKRDWMAEAKGD
jgi:hypothetical protein